MDGGAAWGLLSLRDRRSDTSPPGNFPVLGTFPGRCLQAHQANGDPLFLLLFWTGVECAAASHSSCPDALDCSPSTDQRCDLKLSAWAVMPRSSDNTGSTG
jgi:hypothetical protein